MTKTEGASVGTAGGAYSIGMEGISPSSRRTVENTNVIQTISLCGCCCTCGYTLSVGLIIGIVVGRAGGYTDISL